MNKIINIIKNTAKKGMKIILPVLTILYTFSINAYANIQSTKIVTGTQKLIQDGSAALLIIIPIATVLVGIYFFFRMSMADEQDKKTWQNRIKVLIFGFIGTITFSALVNVIANYYK
jgi:hypothetical protein